MPNLPTSNAGDGQNSDYGGEAPGFIGTLSWFMLTVPILIVVIGILYGLKRWGEESDPDAIGGGARGDEYECAQTTSDGAYHTLRGARGWTGDDDEHGDGTELSRLLEEDEREAFEGDENNSIGDGDSETTAVDGNIRREGITEAAGGASGRWKLKREGFSTTAPDINLATSSSSRGQRGRRNRGSRSGGSISRIPPSGNKDD